MDEIHPDSLNPKTPEIIEYSVNIIEGYGWYIVALAITGVVLWRKILKPAFIKRKNRLEEESYAAKYHKDPDLFQARQETLETIRRRMQEELEKKAEEYLIKQKEVEDAKRLEKIADWERHEKGLGYRSKMRCRQDDNQNRTQNQEAKSKLKPEYNPLTGPGSSSGYRPQRKNVCSGGGCG